MALGRNGASSVCPQGTSARATPARLQTSTAAPATAERVLMDVPTQPARRMFPQKIVKVQERLQETPEAHGRQEPPVNGVERHGLGCDSGTSPAVGILC